MNVVFILCERMLATSVSLPLELLRAAQSLSKFGTKQKKQHFPDMTVTLASLDGLPVETHTGFVFEPDTKISAIEQTDLIYLPALWRNPRPVLKQHTALSQWLVKQYQQGTTIAGVGTGCCFMAQAGLLNNKPATTHWHYFDQFARDYSSVELKRQYFITRADNLFCAASVNSLADLTVYFIKHYYDAHIAVHVERHFFHEIRGGFENSGYLHNGDNLHPDEDIVQAQSWLRDHCHQDISIAEVAKHVGMSIRSFNRRFKNATTKTPLQYLQDVRIYQATELMKTTNLSISEVAYRCGYSDLAYFTALFKRNLGTTPSQYRTTVRGKLFGLDYH